MDIPIRGLERPVTGAAAVAGHPATYPAITYLATPTTQHEHTPLCSITDQSGAFIDWTLAAIGARKVMGYSLGGLHFKPYFMETISSIRFIWDYLVIVTDWL